MQALGSLAHRKMEMHLFAGKYRHMFSALVYAVLSLASLASQSVAASDSAGLVVDLDTNRNSRSVNVVEAPAGLPGRLLKLIIKTDWEELEIDLSEIRFQSGRVDSQTAQDQSEGLVGIETPSNLWLRHRRKWSVGRKVLGGGCSHGRMLADTGKRGPPGSSRSGPTHGKPGPPAPEPSSP